MQINLQCTAIEFDFMPHINVFIFRLGNNAIRDLFMKFWGKVTLVDLRSCNPKTIRNQSKYVNNY
jgi:hypothetical protein